MGSMGIMGTTGAMGTAGAVFVFVPEEVVALGQFLLLGVGGIDGFQRVGIVAGVEHLGRDGHGRRREVLNLFQLIAHFTGNLCQLRHVGLGTTGMAGDEVGDDLLAQTFLLVDAVELALEVEELLKRRLAHQHQHMVAGMLRRHLQSAADVAGDELTGILLGSAIGMFVLTSI